MKIKLQHFSLLRIDNIKAYKKIKPFWAEYYKGEKTFYRTRKLFPFRLLQP